jgi:hypothetical protein
MNRRKMLGGSLASVFAPALSHAVPEKAVAAQRGLVLPNWPELVRAFVGNGTTPQTLQGSTDSWSGGGVEVHLSPFEQTVPSDSASLA